VGAVVLVYTVVGFPGGGRWATSEGCCKVGVVGVVAAVLANTVVGFQGGIRWATCEGGCREGVVALAALLAGSPQGALWVCRGARGQGRVCGRCRVVVCGPRVAGRTLGGHSLR
jgi:hypothetical protein